MARSDLCVTQERKCKNGKKGGFSSRLASDKITTHGYRALTFAKCTIVKIAVLTLTSSMGSSFD
jgi:hypothetical protein